MRKLLLTAVLLLITGCFVSARAERPRIILYTAYRQLGWGDAVQIGCIDENGGLWAAKGHDAELKWPYGWEKQNTYLQTTDHLAEAGQLSRKDLSAIKSLIGSVPAPDGNPVGWMCDAGTESSYAVRYGRAGKPEVVLLGMTGDSFLENTDPAAQSLYRKLHILFPFVRCYAGEITGKWGFQPVPVAEYCHLGNIDWESVSVSAFYTDCENGLQKVEMSEDEIREVIDCMQYAVVTGKENAMCVTGGTTLYTFADSHGKGLGTVELCGGLLVMNDGMYMLQCHPSSD